MEFSHDSVMAEELVEAMNLAPGDIAVDCTGGGGGHSARILKKISPGGKLLITDRDQTAVDFLSQRFSKEIQDDSLIVVKTPFSALAEVIRDHSLEGKIAAICADLGVSSPQFDNAERGFSLQHNGPLDMRMDTSSQAPSARDIINQASYEEIRNLLQDFGEEPKAGKIASTIIRAREKAKIDTTGQLAEIVAGAVHYAKKSRVHPATRTFMALRIAVNGELNELSALLESSLDLLKPDGRLAIISFHSLEDRIVKQTFNRWAAKHHASDPVLRNLPITEKKLNESRHVLAQIIKPFPQVPSHHELEVNPRSRSAKLRVMQKVSKKMA